MPQPRKTQISLDATPYYHCSSRCVRRAYLCGKDSTTGKSYEHRRLWIEERILYLATIFSIDVAAYAVMSNHYHVILHVDQEQAKQWSTHTVVNQWHKLFKGNTLSQRFSRGDALNNLEMTTLSLIIETWRERLYNISWFMRLLNENIARASNQEDQCTGRFWEGRYSSQALLDEKALAACAVYVDLNPIRAKMATSPETSNHTSVKRRIEKAKKVTYPNHVNQQVQKLLPFTGDSKHSSTKGLPFRLSDYLDLVDWTGRIIRNGKRGIINSTSPSILNRLNIDSTQWLILTTRFESRFKKLVGAAHNVKSACFQFGKQWVHGVKACQEAFST